MDKALLRIPEVCEVLGLSRAAVYTLLQRGELRAVKIGTARRIPTSAIDEFVARKQQEAAASAAS